MSDMIEQRSCPKCGYEMAMQDQVYSLIAYIDQAQRGKDGEQASTKLAIPVEVYHCRGCRHIELSAG
jgi:hypothetical protein